MEVEIKQEPVDADEAPQEWQQFEHVHVKTEVCEDEHVNVKTEVCEDEHVHVKTEVCEDEQVHVKTEEQTEDVHVKTEEQTEDVHVKTAEQSDDVHVKTAEQSEYMDIMTGERLENVPVRIALWEDGCAILRNETAGEQSSQTAHVREESGEDKDKPHIQFVLLVDEDYSKVKRKSITYVDDHAHTKTHKSHQPSVQNSGLHTPSTSLRGAQLREEKPVLFPCEMCKESFNSESGRNKHTVHIHRDQLRKVKYTDLSMKLFVNTSPMYCNMCSYRTQQKKYMETHMENVHFFELKIRFVCKICKKQLFNKPSLQGHIREVHSIQKCMTCKLAFKRRSDLRAHNKSFHNIVAKSKSDFKCKICNRTFVKESDMLIHDMMHRQRPTFKCDLCGKNFRTERDMINHVKTVHMVNKQTGHACERCHKSFRSEMQLRMHKTTHDGMYMFA